MSDPHGFGRLAVTDIINTLRHNYPASNTSRIASEARVLIAHIDAQAAEIERLQDLLETAVRQNNAGKLMTQSHIADCCNILKGMK